MPIIIRILLAAGAVWLALVLGLAVAQAQDAAASPSPSLIDDLATEVSLAILAVVSAALTWLVARVKAWINAKVEGEARERLNGAMDRMHAVAMAAGTRYVQEGIAYLKRTMPDAIKDLKASDAQLAERVRAEKTERAAR